MNKLYFVLIACVGILTYPVFGHSKSMQDDDNDGKIHITPLDSQFPVNQLAEPGVQIDSQRPTQSSTESLLSPTKRNRILNSAGLLSHLIKWDELERDLLILRARTHPSEKLKRLYPKLPSDKLEQLKKLLSEEQ